MKWQVSIRDLGLLVAIIAVVVMWQVESYRMKMRMNRLDELVDKLQEANSTVISRIALLEYGAGHVHETGPVPARPRSKSLSK